MLAEVPQDSSSPPDKPSSPSLDTVQYTNSTSTRKILPSGNSRASKKPCKYIHAKQTCPFGVKCHFAHDSPHLDSPLTVDQETDTPKPTTDRRRRNNPRPPSGPRQQPLPDGTTGPPDSEQHRRYRPPRSGQKPSHHPFPESNQPVPDKANRSPEGRRHSSSQGRQKPLHQTPQDLEQPLAGEDSGSPEQRRRYYRHGNRQRHSYNTPRDLVQPHLNEHPDRERHQRDRPPRNRQSYSHRTPDLSPPGSKPTTREETLVSRSSTREARFDSKQPNPVQSSELKQPSADPRKPKQGPSELNLGSFLTPNFNRPPVQRPKPKKVAKSSHSELREVELEQLETRFPDAVLVEKGRERTVYQFAYQPADPEWDFAFKSLTFEVAFPGDYPLKPLTARVPEHEAISDEVLEQVNTHLHQHLTSGAMETGTLMFRPFLHWLDRNMSSILRDSLPKVSVSLEQLEITSESVSQSDTSADGESEEEVEKEREGEEEIESGPVVSAPPKAGTEIRLVGLSLNQSVATVSFSTPKLVVVCGRCKHQEEIRAKPESAVGASCSRCQTVFTAVYHPALLHASSSTVGYLDLNNCSAADLVLLDCTIRMVCLDCNYDNGTKTMMFGQPKDFWCRRCHSKLCVTAQQCQFIKHQPAAVKLSNEVAAQVKVTRSKEPVFKLGQSLPDYGICSHYKKSHRWFRFPCCGKAYPCDVCHDSRESHIMERAKRMICGYCSLEQVYSADKPCSGCGSDLSSTKHTAHWEGGKGCRNKSKMNRLDKHKYTDSSMKTTSQKSKRVGKQEKS